MQGKVFTHRRLGQLFERIYTLLMRQIDSIHGAEWANGMHYPTRWDPTFSEFMTLENLFRYPIQHFQLHRDQIAR